MLRHFKEKNFFNIIRIAYPFVKTLLDEMCGMGKNGGWKKGVSTSDSCWLLRGHYSQCCTFVVVNFLTGCTLYHGSTLV